MQSFQQRPIEEGGGPLSLQLLEGMARPLNSWTMSCFSYRSECAWVPTWPSNIRGQLRLGLQGRLWTIRVGALPGLRVDHPGGDPNLKTAAAAYL